MIEHPGTSVMAFTATMPSALGLRAARISSPTACRSVRRVVRITPTCVAQPAQPAKRAGDTSEDLTKQLLGAAALCAPLLLSVDPALAVDGFTGPLFQGRTVSLVHPITMFFLFGATGYAGYLGWQWRRLRQDVPSELKALKAQLPPKDAEGNQPPSPLDQRIKQVEEERKTLAKGNFRERHNNWGSLLLGLGVLMGVIGPVNTYFRAGKLFPGPHLFAGAGIVVLWALAASLVPQMQKGNDAARNAHIALNVTNLALFAWQVPTGLEIVWKVFDVTTWP